MLNYKKVDTDKLGDQFGIDNADLEKAAKLWVKTQSEINDGIADSMTLMEDGVEYDSRESIETFFKAFNTQELQDIALMQFLMQDLNTRGHKIARRIASSREGGEHDELETLLRRLKDAMSNGRESKGNQEDETDFEELL